MKITTTTLLLLASATTAIARATATPDAAASDVVSNARLANNGDSVYILGAPTKFDEPEQVLAKREEATKTGHKQHKPIETPSPKKEKEQRKKMILAAQAAKDNAARKQGLLKFTGHQGKD